MFIGMRVLTQQGCLLTKTNSRGVLIREGALIGRKAALIGRKAALIGRKAALIGRKAANRIIMESSEKYNIRCKI